MRAVMKSWITTALLAISIALPGAGRAQPAGGDALRALQGSLTLINQEQQAIFQQFQMIQQLRRANAESGVPPVGGGPPGSYEDMAATRRTQAEREETYLRELQDLYQRHRELEQQKQPILDNLRRLYPPPPGAAGG